MQHPAGERAGAFPAILATGPRSASSGGREGCRAARRRARIPPAPRPGHRSPEHRHSAPTKIEPLPIGSASCPRAVALAGHREQSVWPYGAHRGHAYLTRSASLTPNRCRERRVRPSRLYVGRMHRSPGYDAPSSDRHPRRPSCRRTSLQADSGHAALSIVMKSRSCGR